VASGLPCSSEPGRCLEARVCLIAGSVVSRSLLIWAVGDAKRKPLTGVEGPLGGRPWVEAGAVLVVAGAVEGAVVT
jgi:hypothetical protein